MMMSTIPQLTSLSNHSSDGQDDNADSSDLSGVNQSIPFPWKLHEMLDTAQNDGFTDVVSWLPNHCSFKVHRPETFVKDVMPQYFRQTKYKSFQRQLNMWGFERLLTGPNKGGYSHVNFVRGQPALCRLMKRLKIKGTGKKSSSPSSTPTLPMTPVHVVSPVVAALPTCPSLASNNFNAPLSRRETTVRPSGEDLFDEETLLSVLSSAIEKSSHIEHAPQDGDCVLFEGMQFFFVEDYNSSKSSNNGQSRRMSIEVSRRGQTGRRLSLVGTSYLPNVMNGAATFPGIAGNNRRQGRRFSLLRGGSSMGQDYVLKELASDLELQV